MHSVFLSPSSVVHVISVWVTTEVNSLYFDLGRNPFSNRADIGQVDQQGQDWFLKLFFFYENFFYEWDRPKTQDKHKAVTVTECSSKVKSAKDMIVLLFCMWCMDICDFYVWWCMWCTVWSCIRSNREDYCWTELEKRTWLKSGLHITRSQ